MSLLFVVLVLLLICQGGNALEQKISTRKKSQGIQSKSNTFKLDFSSVMPSFASKENQQSRNDNSKRTQRNSGSVNQRLSARSDSVSAANSAWSTLRKHGMEARKEFVYCANLLVKAENNYERLENSIEIMLRHKRAIAVAAVVGTGVMQYKLNRYRCVLFFFPHHNSPSSIIDFIPYFLFL